MVITGSELGRREDVVEVDVVKDTLSDDFLKEFPAALQKGNGAVSFG